MTLSDRSLLFTTAGDEHSLAALPHATALADTLNSPLSVVHVASKDRSTDTAPRIAAALGRLFGAARPPVETIEPKALLPTLLRHASQQDCLVALSPTRRQGLGRLLAGNNFEQLLHAGNLPIVSLPQAQTPIHTRRVLFPIDLSPRSLPLLRETAALCLRLGAELHLLHVFGEDRLPPSERDMARRLAARSPAELFHIDRDHINELGAVASAYGLDVVVKTAEGRAHREILTYAAANDIGLIVMASHGPRSTADILRGTTTDQVIQTSPLPVLACRSAAA
ncbi:MAG TPA: universal stress protein [Roseiflexaceae bacterium]|nr:universal stress protein [Roseiflexaceae bacterium]